MDGFCIAFVCLAEFEGGHCLAFWGRGTDAWGFWDRCLVLRLDMNYFVMEVIRLGTSVMLGCLALKQSTSGQHITE